MTNSERKNAIELLRCAISLAGDGGICPFTDEECDLMYKFLNEFETKE